MRAAQDSVRNSAEFLANMEGLQRNNKRSNNYTSFNITLEIAHNNYSGINGLSENTDGNNE